MKIGDPWASGVLKPDVHERLVASKDDVARRAGLGLQHQHLIWEHVDLKKVEMGWAQEVVRSRRLLAPWPRQEIGLCFQKKQVDAETTMLRLTALLVRNFVDARLMPVNILLAEHKSEGVIDASALMIPDLAVSAYLETMAKWDLARLQEIVRERALMRMPTCVFIDGDIALLRAKAPLLAEMLDDGVFRVEK